MKGMQKMIENDILREFRVAKELRGETQKNFTNIMASMIKERLQKNMNCLALFSGEPGSGKSLSAITLARTVDPTFTLDELPNRVVFTTKQLLDLLIREGKNNQKDLPKGSAIVFDEAGVEVNSRDWQKEVVKDFAKISQTMRFLNYLVIMTVPLSLFIDKQARELITVQFEAVRTRIDPVSHIFYDNRGKFKMYIYEPGLYEGQIFRKFFRGEYQHSLIPFKYVYFTRPPKEWETKYESIKKAFVFPRYEKMKEEIEKNELKEEMKFKKVSMSFSSINPAEKEEKPGIWLKCPHCGYSWPYTGKMTKYTHCPSCGGRVNIENSKIMEAKTK